MVRALSWHPVLIALAAMEKGMEARGLKPSAWPRGAGSVVSHVRIGEEIYSPLIPYGGADVIIGFEPAEAVRCLPLPEKGRLCGGIPGPPYGR